MNKEQEIWSLLESVPDPEVPVLSVTDLGIVREVKADKDNVELTITPTYSGCPAMDVISMNIRIALLQHGYKNIKIKTVLSPPWTTDWMTQSGKQKLKAYGIAPPYGSGNNNEINLFADPQNVQCPLCNSYNTKMISEFGSTACKALYRCNDCGEPFDYFKCH
ncbi:MAG: phenylacetate-CoA oxygenase subunit PaaJ [Chitinophagaceae bacterium]|nr:phenylacetate-CoA oxygenase subunit PaaJ [Chitinophagaceae bacterium]